MKRILPILLIAIVAIGAAIWFRQREANDPTKIRLSGNMELTQVDLAFKIPGRVVELKVREGDFVKKGQLIARLDALQSTRAKEREQASLEVAQAQIAQMGTAIQWQRQTVESDIDLRKADIRQAQAHLDQLLAGSRPQEIAQAQAAVDDARAQWTQAKADWDRAQALFQNEDISRAQFDQYRTRFESVSQLLRQAEQRLSLTKEGPRKEDIEVARAQLARAQAALKLSEANRLEVKRREQELSARQADRQRAEAQVGISDAQLNDTQIVAPMDGVVLIKSAEEGEVIAAGTTIVTVGDLARPWMRAYVGERDLTKVKLGQKVKVSTDSGKTYPGIIGFISSEAEFTPKQIQTKDERVKLVYRIKINVENPQLELKSNMPVDAEIDLT
jgi:HlyD family secretion protein